jgi:FKBP-type peptidyl-prolyl cis-trans isomerase
MKLDSRFFRLSVCAVLLSASTMACSAPGQPSETATPAVSSTPGERGTPRMDVTPIAMTVTEKTEGDGKPIDGAAAFLAGVQIWSDKFDGKPFGKGNLELLVVPESGQMPGLVKAAEGMKVGGVKDVEISAQELFGELPEGARMEPATRLYIRLAPKDVFPEEEFKIETTKPGTGDKALAEGDIGLFHYVGRLDNLKDGKVFDSSREKGQPYPVTMGKAQVIAGWEKGLLGMKKGEIRTLSIPHYLAYGVEAKGDIPAKSRLFFEVELVDFVVPGELKSEVVTEGDGTAIESGQKGDFHYTGWLDKFESDKKFDSSLDRDQPIPVTLGAGQVIKGWDEGLLGMKPGEVRRLTIPFNLAYGPNGRPPTIPPFATLYFEVKYVGPSK